MNKRLTIKDIAATLNISIGTVDRALHNRKGISPKTRKSVLEVAERLGYKTNRSAQSLSRKRSIRLGSIYPLQPIFYPDIDKGIRQAVEDLADFNVELFPVKTKCLGYEEEIKGVESLLEAGVDGLAVCPGHRTAMNPVINKAVSLGVPVVTIATDAPESQRLTCVSTDSFNNGQIAGDLMSSFLQSRGRVAVITGFHEVTDHQEKVRGFIDVVYSYPHAIEVSTHEGLEDPELVFSIVTKLLQPPSPVHGIYINTANCEPACRAVEAMKKRGQVFVIGTDLIKSNIEYMNRGTMQACIFQDPYMQGYTAIKILFETLTTNATYGPYNYVTPAIITKHTIHFYS